MALGVDEANAVSSRYFDQTITSQVYEESLYYSKLKADGKVTWNGGTQIQWPIRYVELGTTRSTGARAQLVYQQKETRTGAVLDYAFYYGHAMISWDEQVKNTGKPQIIDLLKDKTDELNQDIYEKFADDLFATTQAGDTIQALPTIISTSTYAGITTTDAPLWTSNFVNSTETRLTLYGSATSLGKAINSCTFGKSKPTIIVTTRDLYNKAESLVEPQMRYQDTTMANMGFTTVKFHGIPIGGDAKCPSGYMFLIDTDKFELRYHPDYNFKATAWTNLIQAGFPNAMVKVVSWAGNHVCRMRQTSGVFSALDYTK